MRIEDEGLVEQPFPALRRPVGELARGAARSRREALEPRCEMCGNAVIATHCKRICLKCGFMTGCSEGI
jgi:hypothetical protein